MKKVLLLLIFSANLIAANAQREKVTQQIEWFALNSNFKLHKRFGIAFDGQLRFAKNFKHMQHYVRAGGEIYLTPNFSVVPIGYMYVWNFIYGEQPASLLSNEQRIWQQVIYKQRIGRFNLHHRARLEQRWLENSRIPNGGLVSNFYLNRFRYRFLVNYPVNKQNMESGALFVNAWDELFYGWGSYDTFNEIDQNRVSLGLGYQITSNTQILGGAFYQLFIKGNGTQQENNVGLLLQFTYNLDFNREAK